MTHWLPEGLPGVLPPDLRSLDAAQAALAAWRENDRRLDALLRQDIPVTIALDRHAGHLWQEKRVEDSAALLKIAVALAPEQPWLWSNLGAAFNAVGQNELARACVDYSLRLAPHQPRVWLFLATLCATIGDDAAAESAFLTALEQAPELADGWFGLAQLRHRQRRFEDAALCLDSCIACGGGDATIYGLLGQIRYQIGAFSAAADAFSAAVALAPEQSHYRHMLGLVRTLTVAIAGGDATQASTAYRTAAGTAAMALKLVFRTAFGLLNGFGHQEAALRLGRAYLELDPDNPSTHYMLAAVTGTDLTRSPDDYLVEHFNGFADSFDSQLVTMLGYRVPEALCVLVEAVLTADDRKLEVVDAGCGTGLAGPLIRARANTLTGLDLAPRMIEKAAARGVYDHLVETEVTTWLARHPASTDLILAADLLVYIGDVRGLFAAAAIALKPDGLLALSIETITGRDYQLLSCGRFAQDPEYIARTAADHRLIVVRTQTIDLRLEANHPVAGRLFLLRRI
ncbi:Methyltransferase domain-containing protein [uncultured Gammaproteobacteria bacterium]